MAKSKTRYVCSNCGSAQPKWMGKCPDCGEWNSLVETVIQEAGSGPARGRRACLGRRRPPGAARHPGGRLRARAGAHRRAEPSAGRRHRARLGRAHQRRPRHRQEHAAHPALRRPGPARPESCRRRAGALCVGRGIGRADQAARRAPGHRVPRNPGAGRNPPRNDLEPHSAAPAAHGRGRLGPEHLLRGHPVGRRQRDAGARLLGPPPAARQGADLPALPGGPRDERRGHRRAARPGAHGRHGPLPGGRAVPLVPPAPLGQEPLRLDERGRRVRDGGERAGGGDEPVRGVPRRAHPELARLGHRRHDGRHPADPGGGAGAYRARPRSRSRGARPTASTSTASC